MPNPIEEQSSKDIVTEKKFSDLSSEEISSMSEDDAKPFAISQGWRSPENFSGDASKLKSAKDYLSDTFNEMPILRSNLKKIADKNEELSVALSKQSKHFTDFASKQKEKHKVELQKAIDKAEAKMTKAEDDLDVDAVKEEQKNVIEFKNELKEIEHEEKTEVNFAAQEEQRKAKEWEGWLRTPEAVDLQMQDPIKFIGFQQIVAGIYNGNKNLPVADIISKARQQAYASNPKAPHVETGQYSTKVKSKTAIPEGERALIKTYIDNEVKVLSKRGMGNDAIKEYRKKRQADYEAAYKED